MKTVSKMHRAFKIYKDIKRRADSFASCRREGNFGIACSEDYNALQWQKLQFRLNLLESYLEGKRFNWIHASWLSLDEVKRRNAIAKQDAAQ